jgi:hypothetical protein
MTQRLAARFCLIPLAFVTGCGASAGGASAGDATRADAEVVRRESTPEVLFRRGDAFAAVHDATRAEQYYAAALAAGGDAPVLVRGLIRVCLSDQRYRAALAYADDYLRRHPEDHEVRFARTTVAAGVGETELAYDDLTHLSAREHFARYLALAPRGANAAQARLAVAEGAMP